MADPFGTAVGAIGLYIQFGRHFGRDFQTDQLALSCARLRLSRWGESIDIYNDPKLDKPDATATEIQLAKDTLLQILVLFASTKGISSEYKMAAKACEDLSTFTTGDMDSISIALDNKLKALARRRQKGGRFLKLTSWALYHRSKFEDFIEKIVLLIDNIEKLFPASEAQLTLVRQEASAVGDIQLLKLTENTAKGGDSLLQHAVQQVCTGHQYLKIIVRGQAQIGDAYSSNWKGSVAGACHRYENVEVKEGGKALIGNMYGGKDFWGD
ncbi:small s protein [Amylocarpus encephaloides]|uniref:Small s protein n=1 Tax=Amylocarpus encephaloides TaxID=45428 RepID=A0A9P7YK05_9HELO|nr:small s protein [Amylocarpus encephaloides]